MTIRITIPTVVIVIIQIGMITMTGHWLSRHPCLAFSLATFPKPLRGDLGRAESGRASAAGSAGGHCGFQERQCSGWGSYLVDDM